MASTSSKINKRSPTEEKTEAKEPDKKKRKKLEVENLVDQYAQEPTEDYSYLHPALPHPPFRMLINGVSGNGKTNLILNLISKFYLDKNKESVFKRGIFIFSPSVLTDKAYNALTQICPEWVDSGLLHMYPEIDLDNIFNLVSDFESEGEALIVIDDSAASDILNSKKFAEKFLRSRHRNNSWIITTQMYRLVHKQLRTNMSDIIIYNIINDHELALIEHELITNKTSITALKNAFAKLKPHEFLHKDVRANKWFYNFSTEEILN